jgi:Flp pilus assembly protein TadD
MSDWQNGGPAAFDGGENSMENAMALIRSDRLDEAKAVCETLLEAGEDADVVYALAWIAFRKRDGDEAHRLFSRVVELKPDHARAHNNLGTLLMTGGDRLSAIRHFDAAVAAEPTLAEAHGNLGSARLAEGDGEGALAAFQRAMELEPDNPTALSNLATAKLRQGDMDGAIGDYEKAISVAPDLAEAHSNLANALRRQGRTEDARAAIDRGLDAVPDSPDLITNLGIIHYEAGEIDTAISDYDRVLAANPNHRRASFLRAFPLLAAGRFADGWAAYLNRPGVRSFAEDLHRTPLDKDLSAASIVLRSEGNLGADLQFLRFVPELVRRGAKVLIAPGPLAGKLAESIEGIDGIAGQMDGASALDLAPGDLPHLLGIATPADIPPPVKLAPDGARAEAMMTRLRAAGPAPHIGITWQRSGETGGGPVNENMPLEALGKAAGAAGGTVILLQPGAASDVPGRFEAGLGAAVVDFSDAMEDPADSLALLAGLDHYITVPDLGLHLRQAVGGTAEVLVPWPAGYMFAGGGAASPWFPGCRLHRCAAGPSWDAALDSLSAALKAEA